MLIRLLVIFLCINGLAYESFAADNTKTKPIYTQEDTMRLATAIEHINQFYIDPVEYKELVDNAIRGMLTNLDPHSDYLDAESFKLLQSNTSNEFAGIGVEITHEDGLLKVIAPLDGSPAAKAGLQPNDLISHVDGQRIDQMPYLQAVQMIRGKANTEVELIIIRDKEKAPLVKKIMRKNITYSSVKSKRYGNTGYIRIASFSENTTREVAKSIEKFKKGKITGLIIDLRNNPGGLLDSAISTTDLFLDAKNLGENKKIVFTKGRHPYSQLEASATSGDVASGLPIVVVINAGSASASEIFAQALMDHDRAIIIGTRSFGKGSVQTVLPVDESSAIKITTALYYSPNGISIQANGVKPDIEIPDLTVNVKAKEGFDVDRYLREQNLSNHIKNGTGKKKQSNASKLITEVAQKDYVLYQAIVLIKALNSLDDESAT